MPARPVRLPGATLHARDEGRGERALVFCADPPNVAEQYDALVARLARRRRVIVFEPPGFGRSSPMLGGEWGVEGLVRATRELLAVLDAAPATLVFPCVSAYAALAVAERHPAMVEGLVLPQAPAWEDEARWMDRVDRSRALRRPLVGDLVMALRKKDVARRWYDAALPPRAPREDFAEKPLRVLGEGGAFPLHKAFRALEQAPPRLHGVTQPTLLVWGDADRTHRASDPHGLKRLAPHADALTLDGCGHFPELEAPERFADALEAWLDGKGLGARRRRTPEA